MLAVGPLGPQYSLLFAWHELGSRPIWGEDTLPSQRVPKEEEFDTLNQISNQYCDYHLLSCFGNLNIRTMFWMKISMSYGF